MQLSNRLSKCQQLVSKLKADLWDVSSNVPLSFHFGPLAFSLRFNVRQKGGGFGSTGVVLQLA